MLSKSRQKRKFRRTGTSVSICFSWMNMKGDGMTNETTNQQTVGCVTDKGISKRMLVIKPEELNHRRFTNPVLLK